ncbi:MAG: YibE/F family protein [Bacteroidales bacterium]|jgi:uncharacterized membrane protein|nr:YibE/F family protein [Bacteroidales bacterium]MDD2205363.1 YibE/F family protein [Bacteroidales bacterium]MDD3152487.1 YibE/F family protein [Bacteroidales bacterium]MDD3914776.1 YibE/F family protein [Bacteroidales bacterium]MDD4634203.1 YibE/F family protein [Bacteroidales bacterium]
MKPDKYFSIVVGILIIILAIIPTGFENPNLTDSVLFEKAKVLDVDNSDIQAISVTVIGTQYLSLLVKSGQFAGDTIQATNVLLGQKKTDKIFEAGDKVLAVIQLDTTKTKYISARADEYYRQNIELVLLICFGLFLILFAKFTGFKALLSFIFTALALWKLLIPLYLKGYSPIMVALGVVILTSTVIILLVGGLNKKGVVALLGTIAGICFTALLAIIFGRFFKIPGTVQEYSEALLYSGFTTLDFSDMLISTIFISAAGAVMDVSMDISSAQHEIQNRLPDLPRHELIISGFRISAPVIGSMTTTLLFAYSGSFLFAFMAFMAKGVPFESILNTGYIAAEILHTLVGSFGLVLVAPLTAVIGGIVYSKRG